MDLDETFLEFDREGADAISRFRTKLDLEAEKIRMMEDYAECGIGGVLHNLGALRRAGLPIPIRAIVVAVVRAKWSRLRTSWASPRAGT